MNIAILLYGHMRTYEKTYKSFFDNIVLPNQLNGHQVDIFIHTWDVFNVTDANAWHANQNLFPTLSNKKLTKDDMDNIISIYKPKKVVFEKDNGKPAQRYYKVKSVNELRLIYEEEQNIKYDFFITTRPDIYFLKPFILNDYLNLYKNHLSFKDKPLPEKFNFVGCWHFRNPSNFIVMDPRFPNESDLFCVSNYHDGTMTGLSSHKLPAPPLNIFIKYRQNMEYFLCRENTKFDQYEEIISHSLIQILKNDNKNLKILISEKTQLELNLKNQLNSYEDNINKLQQQLLNINKYTNYLSYKLGKELIFAGKNWYKGGFLLYIFRAIKIIREHKAKKFIKSTVK